jgi:hypothetical protein
VGHIAIAKVCGGSRLLFPAAVVKMRQRGIFFACANGGKQLITGDSDSAENCSVSGAPVRRRWVKEWWSGECVAEQRARRKSSCLYWGGEGKKGLKLQRLGKRNLSAAQHNRLHQKTPHGHGRRASHSFLCPHGLNQGGGSTHPEARLLWR